LKSQFDEPEKFPFHHLITYNKKFDLLFCSEHKNQSSGHLGKLGEFFTTRTCDDLIYLLAIPAVPLSTPPPLLPAKWSPVHGLEIALSA